MTDHIRVTPEEFGNTIIEANRHGAVIIQHMSLVLSLHVRHAASLILLRTGDYEYKCTKDKMPAEVHGWEGQTITVGD